MSGKRERQARDMRNLTAKGWRIAFDAPVGTSYRVTMEKRVEGVRANRSEALDEAMRQARNAP